eukprot:scaffold4452_cov40-Cyclotella_meneghiniana.AAC.6
MKTCRGTTKCKPLCTPLCPKYKNKKGSYTEDEANDIRGETDHSRHLKLSQRGNHVTKPLFDCPKCTFTSASKTRTKDHFSSKHQAEGPHEFVQTQGIRLQCGHFVAIQKLNLPPQPSDEQNKPVQAENVYACTKPLPVTPSPSVGDTKTHIQTAFDAETHQSIHQASTTNKKRVVAKRDEYGNVVDPYSSKKPLPVTQSPSVSDTLTHVQTSFDAETPQPIHQASTTNKKRVVAKRDEYGNPVNPYDIKNKKRKIDEEEMTCPICEKTGADCDALFALKQMKELCVVCRSSVCKGEGCLREFSCHRCHIYGHNVKDCETRWFEKTRDQWACYTCFSPLKVHLNDLTSHSHRPVHERVRRALLQVFHVDHQDADNSQTANHLAEIYQFERRWFEAMHQVSDCLKIRE